MHLMFQVTDCDALWTGLALMTAEHGEACHKLSHVKCSEWVKRTSERYCNEWINDFSFILTIYIGLYKCIGLHVSHVCLGCTAVCLRLRIYSNVAGGSCAEGELSMDWKCYRKLHSSYPLTWYSASNDCLSRGGSLAVFTDIGRPRDNIQLSDWLHTSGTDKTYWIGLLKSWWKTTNEGNRLLCKCISR